MGLLDTPVIHRVRRNHAVEHATIHVLAPRCPDIGLAGRADTKGFYLYGRVGTDDVRAAVNAALERLIGEPELAVHPRCGTNLVVSGLVAGLSSLVAVATMPSEQHRSTALDVLPRLLLAGTAAAVASQALGPMVQQRYTTSPQVDGVRVVDIEHHDRGALVYHRVLLAGPAPGHVAEALAV